MGTLQLYAISDEYIAALKTLESLADAGTLSAEVVADTLEGMAGDVEAKATNVIAYARSLELESNAIREAFAPMLERAHQLDKKAEWMRAYVKTQMERTGITEIKSPYFVLKIRENPASVVIDNEAGMPETCWRVIPEKREPNKKAIQAMIEAGECVEFAHLEKTRRLQVK